MASNPTVPTLPSDWENIVLPPNPKQAYGDKKPPVHLVPSALIFSAARALGEGAVKYGPYNWREKSVEVMTYAGAMIRHLYAWMDGEDIDPESVTGKSHLDGMAACIAILVDAIECGCAIDNRPPKGAGARLSRGTGAPPPTIEVMPIDEDDPVADPPTPVERPMSASGEKLCALCEGPLGKRCWTNVPGVGDVCDPCHIDWVVKQGAVEQRPADWVLEKLITRRAP